MLRHSEGQVYLSLQKRQLTPGKTMRRLPHSRTKPLFQALPTAFGHPPFQAVRYCPHHSDGKKIFSPWASSQRLSAVLPMNCIMKTGSETRLSSVIHPPKQSWVLVGPINLYLGFPLVSSQGLFLLPSLSIRKRQYLVPIFPPVSERMHGRRDSSSPT